MVAEGAAGGPGAGEEEAAVKLRPLLREIWKFALPNIATYTMSLINEVTNIVFLGHMGNDAALAAIGVGNMMQNCIGLSVGFGFCGALDTLVSQAYGAGQHRLSVQYLQRCRVIVTLQLLWMVPLLCFSEPLLVALHQNPEVSKDAGAYNRATVWGLLAIFQSEANRKFLQNRGLTHVPAVISGVCSALHFAWCYAFVVYFGLGTAGAGYANVVTWWLQYLGTCLYLGCNARGMGFSLWEVLGVQAGGLREWGSFMKVAMPATVQLCSEWWFWEICALIVGLMGEVALAAHVSAINFVVISFMPAIGVQVSTATLVGNALGANLPRKAKATCGLCVGLNLAIWTVLAAVMVAGRHLIAEAYTSSDDVRSVMQKLLCIFAVAGFFDSTQNVMGGAMRGLGKNRLAAGVYLLAFYCIMLPVGCVLAFVLDLGVYGIWYSFVVGTAIGAAVFGRTLCTTDFKSLAEEASTRMEREGREATAAENLLEARELRA